MSLTQKKQSIIDACLRMNALDINQGTSGNISLRHEDGLLITPTSLAYEAMTTDDIVFLRKDGAPEGRLQPSTEWRFHRDIMQSRPEVDAIVHAHPIFATTLAILEKSIPPIHYMIAVAGGPTIRCAPYAIFGSSELSMYAVKALEGRKACLLAHHGMIVCESSLEKALWLAVEVETLAREYHGCLQIGEPPLLSEQQIADVVAKIGGYGFGDQERAA